MTPETACTLIGLLDLTALGDDDSAGTVEELCRRAVTPVGSVAAVCLWPRFVALARRLLDATEVRVATVVNFPDGDDDAAAVALATRCAVADGADEVDVVLPWRAFLAGDKKRARAVIRACRDACGDAATFKVIFESGSFPDMARLREAADAAIVDGASFLKTSTGKSGPGASLEAVGVLLDAITAARRPANGRTLGIKPSGGIRTPEQAQAYLDLASARMGAEWVGPDTFRIGASSLLEALLTEAQS